MTYTGTVNNQGNEAKGKWTSTGRYSGSWKMVKMKEPIQSAQQEASLPRSTNRSIAPEQAKKDEKEKTPSREVTHSLPTGKNVKALQEKARELARQGKWAEAAKLAEQVVEKAPRSLKDRRFFGLYLLSASQYPRGIHELEKVLKDGQTDVVVEHHLGHAYYKVGSYDKALNAFQKAIALDPANPRHYKCGARLIVDVLRLKPSFNGNLALAMTWYEKALALGMRPAQLAEINRFIKKWSLPS
jgi:tetratricopeptide (TPR) repeat protein